MDLSFGLRKQLNQTDPLLLIMNEPLESRLVESDI